MGRGWRRGVAGLTSALVLVACTGEGDDAGGADEAGADDDVPDAGATDAADETAGDADGGGEPAVPEALPADDVNDADDADDADGNDPAAPEALPGDPLATVVRDVPGADGTQVTVDVRSMEVVGELLRVRVAFTATWDDDPELTLAQLLGAGPGAPAAGVDLRLIDPVNLLEYATVRPSLPNGESVRLEAGTTLLVPFYLGAPEEVPETFDVHLDVAAATAAFPPLLDVPYEPGG